MRRLITLGLFSALCFAQITPYPPTGGGGGGGTFCAATMTANVATCPGSPVPTSLTGLIGSLTVSAANTGAWTLNIASLGAKSVLTSAGATPSANQVVVGSTYLVSYNGTNFIVTPAYAPSSSAVSNVTPVTVAANTTSAQVLQQLTIPAALLNIAGAPYTYNASGIYTAAALQTPTLTWTLNACTVSGCGSGTVRALAVILTPAVVTATNNTWNIRLAIANTATGATGTLITHGTAVVELTVASDLGTPSSDSNTASSSTIDLTGIIYLQLTVTTSTGNAGNSITADHSSLEPASATGATGAQGSLGNSPIYTTSQTMAAGDQFNAVTFNGTGLSYTILATPPNANFWVLACNASLAQTLTINAVANSASIYGQGSPTNFTVAVSPTAGLSQCIRLSSNADGSQWVGGYVGSQGPTGATGSTGPSATVVSGTSALGTSAISSAACATVVTTAATGALTTDNVTADFNADPTSTTGYSASAAGMLTIIKYITSGNVNFKVCNNTAGSVTPGAVTLQWRVIR